MASVVLETYQNGVSWSEKAILASLGLISSLVAVFQQTYFLLDLHNRHYYGLRQRLALTLTSSKPIRGTRIRRRSELEI